MRKIYFLLIGLSLTAGVFITQQASAQAPQKMSYQSVIRNSSNALFANTAVGIKISVLQGTASGNAVYVETQTATTNANGLVSLQIGTGTASTGPFSGIDWSTGPYFIKTETDPAGGTTYTITGTQELLSVPYAMYAKNGITTAQSNSIVAMQAQINSISAFLTRQAYTAGSVFCTSGATLVVDVTNPTTGKTWMDRNMGAIQVATSSTDAFAYGDLYQWGRDRDGHQCLNSPIISTLSSTDQPGNGNFIQNPSSSPFDWRSPQNVNLWQGVNGINNPCPIGYRLPTESELNAERVSWSSNNAAGAFASPLKLTMAGARYHANGALFLQETQGYYWSSTVATTKSRNLNLNTSASSLESQNRSYGFSVRCIKD